MGFAVSGATVVVFIGLLISASVLYGTVWESYESIDDARRTINEQHLDRQNTDVNVTYVDAGTDDLGDLTVDVENTGSTTLTVGDTDLVVDNNIVTTDLGTRTVDGDAATDLWQPGETLRVTVTRAELDTLLGSNVSVARVKVVSDAGVSDTEVL